MNMNKQTTNIYGRTMPQNISHFQNFENSKIFLAPLLGALGLLPLFETHFLAWGLTTRRFDYISCFLIHGNAKRLNYRVQSPCPPQRLMLLLTWLRIMT
jgi:hypothetical protein